MRRDGLPQTVAFALGSGWSWLRIRCVSCRHEGTISLSGRRSEERLQEIARRAWCSRCRRRPTEILSWLGGEQRVIPVGFEGRLIGPVEHHG